MIRNRLSALATAVAACCSVPSCEPIRAEWRAIAAQMQEIAWFGEREATSLVQWVPEHAAPLAPGGFAGDRPRTADGKGVVIRAAQSPSADRRAYLVPLAALGEGRVQALRAALFPRGEAAVPVRQQGAAEAERMLAPASLGPLHLRFDITAGNMRCGEAAAPCDSVSAIAVYARVSADRDGAGAGVLIVPLEAMIDPSALVARLGPDPVQSCGFDPERTRVPQHVAAGCDGVRLLRFAAEQGFAADRFQRRLTPLTPGALRILLDEATHRPAHLHGAFRGRFHPDPAREASQADDVAG